MQQPLPATGAEQNLTAINKFAQSTHDEHKTKHRVYQIGGKIAKKNSEIINPI